jgi:hypothetical protein
MRRSWKLKEKELSRSLETRLVEFMILSWHRLWDDDVEENDDNSKISTDKLFQNWLLFMNIKYMVYDFLHYFLYKPPVQVEFCASWYLVYEKFNIILCLLYRYV